MNTRIFVTLFVLLMMACSPKTTESVVNQTVENIVESTEATGAKDLELIPIDERVITGTLENGMQYYIQQNTKPENRAEIRLALKVGSIMEDEDQQGVAHFVEHMAFNGTEHFAKNELVNYLESTGAKFGPDLNAYTSFDETVYMLQVRTDSSEIFDKGLLIFKDWAHGVVFEDEEIDKERGVVESERRSRLSPDQRLFNKYFPVMYQGSQYADRLPIGKENVINNGDYSVFKRFYKDWYRPELMALVVVGDFDPSEVERKIKTQFSAITNPEDTRARTKFSVPIHEDTYYTVASDKEAAFTQVQIQYKHPHQDVSSLQDYRSQIVQNLYNRMLGQRLNEIRNSTDPPFIFANTRYGSDVGDIDAYRSFSMVPEGKAEAALSSLLTENKRVLEHGFLQSELDREKGALMEEISRGVKEMDKTESRRLAMRYVYNFLKNNPVPSPLQMESIYTKYLDGISLTELNDLASNWIRDQGRVVVVTGPEKEESPLPSESRIKAIIDSIDHLKVNAYTEDVLDQPLFDAELEPVAIVDESIIENIDVKYFELDNGVKIYYKKTDFQNDEISFDAMSPGGHSLYSGDDYYSATNASRIIAQSGLGDFNYIQLGKLLSGKTVSVYPYIGTNFEGLEGSSSVKDFELMFQLINLYFNAPRQDKDALDSYVTKQKGIFKNILSNPNYFFSDYSSHVKYGDHERVGFATEEDLNKINMDKVWEIYQDRFADASDFNFVFVGNFEEEQLKMYAQKYLGNLPSTDRKETWKDTGLKLKEGHIVENVNKGEAPKTFVELFYHGDYNIENENQLVFKSMTNYLRIKLREALREDKGGVYGVGVRGSIQRRPHEEYRMRISFNSEPENTNDLVLEAKRIIELARNEKPSEEDMTKVREIQKQERIKAVKENDYWLGGVMTKINNEDTDWSTLELQNFIDKIDAVEAQQIMDAVNKYFDEDSYIEIIMAPELTNSNGSKP